MLIDWQAIPTSGGMRPGSARQAIAAEQMSAVRVVTAPDASFATSALHSHANEQLLIMIRGSVELEVDGKRFWASAGDCVFFPSGSVHGATAVGPDGCEYYEIFSPPRYDQLPGYIGSSPMEYH